MNTKNRIFALLIAILALGSVLHATITFRPAGPAPGQTVTFTLNPTHPDMVRDNQITWVWSDGTQLIVPTTQLTAAHVYASAGAYEVSARYYYRSSTGAPTYFAETIGVRVAAAGKTIAFSPGNPNSCAPVTFQARGFLSAQLRWEFGDGTVLTGGGAAATHAYTAPGSFKVKVFDYDGRDPVPAAKVVAVADKRSIKILTASPKAGEPVDFKASGFVSSCIRWEFGDGGSTSNGTATAGHVYAAAGTFQVKAVDQCGDSHCTAMVNVKVGSQKPKTVAFQPEKPNSCEPVTFQASGFVSTKLRWEFGDGTVLTGGGVAATHAYAAPGSFNVKVFDDDGRDPVPAAKVVAVADKRSIKILTTSPEAGEPVDFQVSGFVSSCIRWEFGDGESMSNGAATAGHVYAAAGTFQVKAVDQCGESPCTAMVSVPVAASQEPPAAFTVSYGSLRFANGKTSISVGRNTSGVTAFADLKFEGSGLLQVEWKVDGQSFKTATQGLGLAGQVTIDTGNVPGLPTAVTGPHTVSLRIVKPEAALTITDISYYVAGAPVPLVMPPSENLQAPIIQTIIPDSLERGKKYVLDLQGMRITSDTVVSLGAGISMASNGFTFINPMRASLAVSVSPTANPGDRHAKASNANGANTGPGKVKIAPPPPEQPMEPVDISLLCTDLSTLVPEEIELKEPAWFLEPLDLVGFEDTGDAGPIYNQGPPEINLHTVDDLDVLEWWPLAPYDYIEVRFYKAKTNKLLLTRRLDGAATSMPISGSLLVELWNSFSADTGLILMNMGAYAPGSSGFQTPVDLSDIYIGAPTEEQKLKELFQEAQKKADISWQVAGFRVFPCAYDSKKNTPAQTDQAIELGLSAVGLFDLPDRPNGVTCPATGMNSISSPVKVQNSTKAARDLAAKEAAGQASADFQGSGTSESITDYVGDTFDIAGNIILSNSPYGSLPRSGTAPKIPNLFIDWGDGSGAKPLDVEIFDAGKSSWDKSLRLRIKTNSPNSSHVYKKAGSDFVIRIFELSEGDIQQPAANFLAKLGKALAPPQAHSSSSEDSSPYDLLLENQGGGPINESAAAFSAMLGRAYMLFCRPVTIYPYHDTCVDQPLKLLGIEVVSFPGHNIYKPKDPQGGSESDGIKLYSLDLAKYLMAGINAVAVTCDTGLFAKAELTYVGTGYVEFLWIVDGAVVEKRLYEKPLTSEPRPDLTAAQAQDCSQARSSRITVDSSPEVLPVGPGNTYLGKHKVNILARVVAGPTQLNLYQYAAESVLNMVAAGIKRVKTISGQGGPFADPWSPAVQETHVSDPLLAALQEAQAHGQAVPQIGFLNPDPEAEGPAVVYLNDSLAATYTPEETPTGWVMSEDRHYQVNEVRNKLGCQVLIPESAGGSEFFKLTDMGYSIVLNDDGTYSASTGTLHLPYLTGQGSYKKKPIPIQFANWAIDPETGIVQNGLLNVSTPGASDFQFPAFIQTAQLKHLQGGVDQGSPQPMLATFDFDFASKLLGRIEKGAEHPASILGAIGRLTAGGDWNAFKQKLEKTEIGRTGFSIMSEDVTIDLSATGSPAPFSAIWTGVHFGKATITPYTLGFTPDANSGFTMNTTEAWVLQAGHLNGRAKSTPFQFSMGQAFFKFGSVDFGVAQDVVDGTYNNLSVKAPWLAAALSGNAILSLQSNGTDYNTILTLDHAPVVLTYPDPARYGQVTMTASDFRFKTATLGASKLPAVECVAVIDLQCEGNPFAQLAVNDFDFLFDGRALFGQKDTSRTLPLNGLSQFGQSDATLKQAVLTAPDQGAGRLGIAVDIDLGYAKDPEQAKYVPATPATITYRIAMQGANYVAQGPESQSIPITLKFPLGNPDLESVCKPAYQPQLGNSSSGGGGSSGPSAGEALPGSGGVAGGTRFSAKIPLSVFGAPTGSDATFILGYNDQGSYFLTAANVSLASGIPLAPIPLSIFGFKGGFGYHFDAPALATADVGAQPNMTVDAAFAAGVTLGTSDKFTFTTKAVLAGDSSGHFLMLFSDAQLLKQGNFGGRLEYYNKVFSGNIFGELKLFQISDYYAARFDLGKTMDKAAISFSFGGGSWHIYAGDKNGQRIAASILGIDASGYLMLDDKALQAGGGIVCVIPSGADKLPLSVYIKSKIEVGFGIFYVPAFRLSADFLAKVGVGGCIPIAGCEDFSVGVTFHFEAPDPTIFKGCFTIDWPIIGEEDYCKELAL
jgi:hypothetical protein